jgi:inosine-uridine nucleoside N-ribohydrolase
LAVNFDHPADFVHGVDSQGNVNLAPPTLEPALESGPEFIVSMVMAHPHEITLIGIGPLTNLALALRLQPQIVDNVKEVIVMGGNAFAPGNATPTAEANIYNDPEAADVVFGAGWRVTMVGLDVTMKCIMTRRHIAKYATANNPLAQHIHQIVPFYQNFIETTYGVEGIHVHDSTAIAYAIMPEAFRTVGYPIRVETQGFSRGKTWIHMGHASNDTPWQNRPKVNICVGVDSAKTLTLELDRLMYEDGEQ